MSPWELYAIVRDSQYTCENVGLSATLRIRSSFNELAVSLHHGYNRPAAHLTYIYMYVFNVMRVKYDWYIDLIDVAGALSLWGQT